MRVHNLTVLTLNSCVGGTSAETFRAFILNNHFLETLSLERIFLQGSPNGPPVQLSNLGSLGVGCHPAQISALVRVPALRRLSSLSITRVEDTGDGRVTFHATGDEIVFSVKTHPHAIAKLYRTKQVSELNGGRQHAPHKVRSVDWFATSA